MAKKEKKQRPNQSEECRTKKELRGIDTEADSNGHVAFTLAVTLCSPGQQQQQPHEFDKRNDIKRYKYLRKDVPGTKDAKTETPLGHMTRFTAPKEAITLHVSRSVPAPCPK